MIALYAAPSGLLPSVSACIERYAAVGNAYLPQRNKYSYAYLTTFLRKNQPVLSKTLNCFIRFSKAIYRKEVMPIRKRTFFRRQVCTTMVLNAHAQRIKVKT